MGVAADELVGDALERIGEREMARFRFELRQEHGFEDEVAQFFAKRGMIVPVYGVDDLIALLEDEGFQRVDGLFAIPGAAVRAAERGHDFEEADELPASPAGIEYASRTGRAAGIGHLIILVLSSMITVIHRGWHSSCWHGAT